MFPSTQTRAAITAAAALLFSLIPAVSLALGPDCAAPGPVVLTDAAGDQIGNADTDIQSISIAESSSTSRNLLFTIKTGLSQGTMTPNGRWIATFKANTPAKDYYVAMITSPEANGGKPTFYYGTGISGFGGTDSLGRGLEGSAYDAATGTIRIVAPISSFAVSANNVLSTIAGAVRLSGGACDVACLNGAAADTATSAANYIVAGSCGTLLPAPVGGLNNSSPGPVFGGPDIAKAADGRYQVFAPPAGIGADGSAGEYSIGYNPITKRIMANSLGFSVGSAPGTEDLELFSAKVFRVTTPELLTPAQEESCDALWEDKSNLYNYLPMVLSDPILWTDQDTGRTFSADLTTGPNPSSQYAFTDDDGETWIPGGTGIAGADHQTITTGFYPVGSPFELIARNVGFGQKDAAGKVVKGKAVYFCSQDLVPGTCVRSDDGGITWTPPQVAYDGTLCSNLHGHLKVASDGTAYLPIKGCGNAQGGSYTTNAGTTWTQFNVPGTTLQADGSDPSFAIDDANKLYYCYVNGDGHPHVKIGSKLGDGSLSWGTDTDLGSAHGIVNAVFPEAVGGDSGRAACGFLGTNEPGTNYQSRDFKGVWHLYIATTTDGGQSWTTVNATPNDPVQGVGGIWQQGGSGDTNNNRNLLDFNEVTMDEKGRVLFGYNDGCVGACDGDPVGAGTLVASMRVVRQTGGKTLRAAFDSNLGSASAPGVACFSGADAGAAVGLSWKQPDNGGSALRYEIEKVYNNGTASKVGDTESLTFTVPSTSLASAAYRIRAVNGTASTPTRVLGTPSAPPAVVVNTAPTSSLTVAPSTIVEGDPVTFTVALADAEGHALRYNLDFGDGSLHATGIAGETIVHNYTATGNQSYTAVLTVVETATNPALAASVKMAAVTQTAKTTGGTGVAITVDSFTATPSSGDVTNAPLNVQFDVSATDSDPERGNVSYTFYYGDGTRSERQVSASSTHAYNKAGSYQATVIVADDHANSAVAQTTVTTTTTVTVLAGPVTADLKANFDNGSSQVPATVTLDGSGSSSAAGAIYEFSFGDGTAGQTGTAKIARHVYTTPGTFTVTLKVTDKDNASDTATATATVTTTATQQTVAQFSVNPSTVRVGETVRFDASGSIAATNTRITSYSFDFGDGTPVLVQAVPSPDDGSAALAQHSYGFVGSFTPSVTVTDSSGTANVTRAQVKVGAVPKPVPGATVTAAPSGGALPLWTLMPLLALAGLRRRRKQG